MARSFPDGSRGGLCSGGTGSSPLPPTPPSGHLQTPAESTVPESSLELMKAASWAPGPSPYLPSFGLPAFSWLVSVMKMQVEILCWLGRDFHAWVRCKKQVVGRRKAGLHLAWCSSYFAKRCCSALRNHSSLVKFICSALTCPWSWAEETSQLRLIPMVRPPFLFCLKSLNW